MFTSSQVIKIPNPDGGLPTYMMPVPTGYRPVSEEEDSLFFPLASIVGSIASSALSSVYSFVCHHTSKQWQQHAPLPLQEMAKTASDTPCKVLKSALNVAYIVGSEATEMVFPTQNRTHPIIDIQKHQQRLENLHSPFHSLITWGCQKIVETYQIHSSKLKTNLFKQNYTKAATQSADSPFFSKATLQLFCADLIDYCGQLADLDFHQDLVAKLIESNILNISANLCTFTKKTYEERGNRAAFEANPLGCMAELLLEIILEPIHLARQYAAHLDKDEAQDKINELFCGLSDRLLNILFPKQEEEIKLFHPILPTRYLQQVIWKQLTTKLPLLFQNCYQEFYQIAFVKHAEYQAQLVQLKEGEAFVKMIHQFVEKRIDQGVKKLIHLPPIPGLAEEAQEVMQAGILGTIRSDSIVFQNVKFFIQHYLESVIFQASLSLYQEYQQETAAQGEEKVDFVLWLINQVIRSFEHFLGEECSEKELELFKQAIILKNRLCYEKDEELMAAQQKELDHLWKELKPKFDHFTTLWRKRLGWGQAANLPFLSTFQNMLANLLNEHLSKVIFQETSDVFLPFLERAHYRKQLKALPKGELWIETCQSLLHDLNVYLPKLREKGLTADRILNKLKIEKRVPGLKHFIAPYLDEFLQKNVSYDKVWPLIEGYVEGMLLKAAVNMAQMDGDIFHRVQQLLMETRTQLAPLQSREEIFNAFEQFVDKLLAIFTINSEQDLYGIPHFIRHKLLKRGKAKVAKKMTNAYLPLLQLQRRGALIKFKNEQDSLISESEVAKGLLQLTIDIFDVGLAKAQQKVTKEGIHNFYQFLLPLLGKHEVEGVKMAGVCKQMILDGIAHPFWEDLIGMLNSESTETYKSKLAQLINPLLTEQVLRVVTPLLKKEQEKAALMQNIIAALIPVLTNHLKNLNQISKKPDGRTFSNFVQVAQNLHPAITRDQSSKAEHQALHFYQPQAKIIINYLFPHGKDGLATIVPELSPKLHEPIWNFIESSIEAALPEIIPRLLNRKTLTIFFTILFKKIGQGLSDPIRLKPSHLKAVKVKTKRSQLDQKEIERQKQMDCWVGELIVQGTQFMKFPIYKLEQMPNWLKQLVHWDGLKRKSAEAIGSAIRQQFSDTFIVDCLRDAFREMGVKREPVPRQMNMTALSNQDLKSAERSFVHAALRYPFRFLQAKMDQKFGHPNNILKKIGKAMVTVWKFIFHKLVNPLLRLLKIGPWLEKKIFERLDRLMEKLIGFLSLADIHENAIFQAVERIEQVLAS